MKFFDLVALVCLCLVVLVGSAPAAVTRQSHRQRTTCTSGTCGQPTAAPRVARWTQTTRTTTTTTVRRSR